MLVALEIAPDKFQSYNIFPFLKNTVERFSIRSNKGDLVQRDDGLELQANKGIDWNRLSLTSYLLQLIYRCYTRHTALYH